MIDNKMEKIAAVWAAAEQSGSIDVGAASKSLGLSDQETLKLLASDALAGASTFASPWTSHFMDIAIAAIFGGLAVFLWFAFHHVPTATNSMRVTVAAYDGLRTLQVIAPSDIKLKSVKEIQGSFEKLDDVIGRYAVNAMKKDDVVTSRDLSVKPLPGTLTGRMQILLPLNSGVLFNSVGLPRTVSVIAAPKCRHTQTKTIILDDIYLMAFNTPAHSAGVAVVALKPEQLSMLAPILGCAEFTVAMKFEAPK